ncbi:hypothetical protein C8J56DRAFT_1067884 [Mycena floridula]|nr:hypothetical protein C8J56DRAFT_1067884 [Mycena floridula]
MVGFEPQRAAGAAALAAKQWDDGDEEVSVPETRDVDLDMEWAQELEGEQVEEDILMEEGV